MRMTQKLRRIIATSFVALFATTLLIGASTPTVFALATDTDTGGSGVATNPEAQLESWFYYRGMWACLEGDGALADMSYDEAMAGKWDLAKGKEGFGYVARDLDNLKGNDGWVECDDSDIWTKGAKIFGFSDPVALLCEMNRQHSDKDAINPDNDSDCENSNNFEMDNSKGGFQSAFTKALDTKGQRPKQRIGDNPDWQVMLYLMGKRSLETYCGPSPLESGIDDRTDDKTAVKVGILNASGQNEIKTYRLKSGVMEDKKFDGTYYKSGNDVNKADDLTCEDFAKYTRDYAADYAAWAKENPELLASINSESDSSGNSAPSCESEGGPLGWLLCAVINALDGFIKFLDISINRLLFINEDIYNSESIAASWAVIRNIALFILVPMMMFMVIGTAIGVGPFDAYTVKKSLPRMLIAAIFIVLSLPITQFGVELSNAVGQGIGNLILSASPNKIESIGQIINESGKDDTFGGLVAGGVTGAALFGGLTIGIIGSFALVTALALLLGFVILVMRQVLVLLLVVIAPLAILVWIFPGNDKLWALWKTTFIAMLLLYPIIAILIASGRFVAGIAQF